MHPELESSQSLQPLTAADREGTEPGSQLTPPIPQWNLTNRVNARSHAKICVILPPIAHSALPSSVFLASAVIPEPVPVPWLWSTGPGVSSSVYHTLHFSSANMQYMFFSCNSICPRTCLLWWRECSDLTVLVESAFWKSWTDVRNQEVICFWSFPHLWASNEPQGLTSVGGAGYKWWILWQSSDHNKSNSHQDRNWPTWATYSQTEGAELK